MDKFSNFVGYNPYAAIAPVMGEQPMKQSDDEFAGLMEFLDGQPGQSLGVRDSRQSAFELTPSGDASARTLPMADFRAMPASSSCSPDIFRHSFEPMHGLDLGVYESTMSTISAVPASDFGASNGLQDPPKLTTGGDMGVQWPREVDLSATQWAPLRSCDGLSNQVAPSTGLGKAPQSQFAPQGCLGDAVGWAPQGRRAAVSVGSNALMLPQSHYLPFSSFAHMDRQGLSGQSVAAISAAPDAFVQPQSQFAAPFFAEDANMWAPHYGRGPATFSAVPHPVTHPYGQFALPPSVGDAIMQAPYRPAPAAIPVMPRATVLGQRTPSPWKEADKQADGKSADREGSAMEEEPAAGPSGEKQKRKNNNPRGAYRGLRTAKYIHMKRCREQGRCLAECRLAIDFPKFYARSLTEWVPGS
ncbi:hypothetical protein LTR12_005684 [Friedmanniomyces endolithicus]|nr:hypothetical protein LTR12_005684 [Friedmanniomyces endolithicus]